MSHQTSCRPNLADSVDDDFLIAVFVYLVVNLSIVDAVSFLKTCTKTRNALNDPKSGKPHYLESKNTRLTRMPVQTDTPYPFTEQMKMERVSNKRVIGFYKACEAMCMHCATDCCKQARCDFNQSQKSKKLSITPVSTSVRLVASASMANVVFTYGREHDKALTGSRKPMQVAVLRKIDASSKTDCVMAVLTTSVSVLQMVSSPNGRYCAFITNEHVNGSTLVTLMVWDTLNPDTWHRLACNLNGMGTATCPQTVWWAQEPLDGTYHLLTAWHGTVYNQQTEWHGAIYNQHDGLSPLVVVDYGPGPMFNSPRTIYHFSCVWQRFDKISGMGWKLAVLFTTVNHQGVAEHTTGFWNTTCFNVKVIDCKSKSVGLVYTFNPCKLYSELRSTEDKEIVYGPVAISLSPSGQHVVVVAQDFKWRCYHDNQCMFLVLYTRCPTSNEFVRTLGSADELRIPISPTQGRFGWETIFSPCGAYIALVYAHNRYKNLLVNPLHQEHAVHFIHIHPKGLRRAQPSHCPNIRQIAWTKDALLVVPKHGAVSLT